MIQLREHRTEAFGISLGIFLTLLIAMLGIWLLPDIAGPFDNASRLALAAKCLVAPAIMMLLGVIVVGLTRLGSDMLDPTRVNASTQGMRVSLRYLGNTHEQLTLYIANSLALAVLLPAAWLKIVPLYALMFCLGRVLFWVGYRLDPLYRAPGFALTILPTIAAMLFNFGALIFL
nr:MAPEG family protein [uncultured Halomonas sp.]